MNTFKKTIAEVLGKNHPLFNGFKFAAAARSRDEERQCLQLVLVERDPMNELITQIIATDGKRMHIHTYDAGLFDDDIGEHMIQPGLYEVIANSKSYIVIAPPEGDWSYPNWRMLQPEPTIATKQSQVSDQSVSIISAKTGLALAVDFLRQGCGFGCGASGNVMVNYGTSAALSIGKMPLIITHDLGTAIIMPIQWDDSEDSQDEIEATAEIPGIESADDEEDDEPPTIAAPKKRGKRKKAKTPEEENDHAE